MFGPPMYSPGDFVCLKFYNDRFLQTQFIDRFY